MANMTFSELREKELVNICDGACFGRVSDMELDPCAGTICALIAPGPPRFFGLMRGPEELVIPFASIRKIGDDVILVDAGDALHHKRRFERENE